MIRDGLFNVIATVSGAAASALISVLVARSLSVDDAGGFGVLTWLVSLGVTLASLGAPTVITRHVAEAEHQGQPVGRFIRRVLIRHAALAAGIAGVLYAAMWVIGGARQAYLPGVLAIIPATIATLSAAVYRGRGDFSGLAARQVLISLAYALLAVTVLAGGLGLDGLALIVLGQAILSMTLFSNGLPPRHGAAVPSFAPRYGALVRSLSLLAVIDLVVWQRSEVLFLMLFHAAGEIAMYTLPFSLVGGLMLIPGSLAGVLLPKIASRHADPVHSGRIYTEGVRQIALITLPLAAGAVLFARPIVILMLGPAYEAAVGPFRILAIGSAVTVIGAAGSALLVGEGAVGFMVRWGLVAAVLNLALDLLLIPRWGATGAALANSGAQVFAIAVTLLYLTRVRRLHVPWRSLARLGAGAVLAGAASRILWAGMPSAGVPALLATGVVGLIVFLGVLLANGELRSLFAASRSLVAR